MDLFIYENRSTDFASLFMYNMGVSLVLKSEAAGSFIAPWWLAAVQVINPALSV